MTHRRQLSSVLRRLLHDNGSRVVVGGIILEPLAAKMDYARARTIFFRYPDCAAKRNVVSCVATIMEFSQLCSVSELQNGRISVLSYAGYFVSEYLKWPGHHSPAEELKFEDIPNGLATFDKVLFIG